MKPITKKQLLEKATALQIVGRSRMSKSELASSIKKAERKVTKIKTGQANGNGGQNGTSNKIPQTPIEYLIVHSPSAAECLREYVVSKKLGEGAGGTVFSVCKSDVCQYVLKISTLSSTKRRKVFETDVQALKELQKTGAVPTLYDSWVCKIDGIDRGFIVLEQFDYDLDTFTNEFRSQLSDDWARDVWPKLQEAIAATAKAGWDLTDWHMGNVLINVDKSNRVTKLALTDWGLATRVRPDESQSTIEDGEIMMSGTFEDKDFQLE